MNDVTWLYSVQGIINKNSHIPKNEFTKVSDDIFEETIKLEVLCKLSISIFKKGHTS